jgi:hypothetical protein
MQHISQLFEMSGPRCWGGVGGRERQPVAGIIDGYCICDIMNTLHLLARGLMRMHLAAFAKLRKCTVNFVMPVCLRGITPLPLDGFL